MTEFIDWYGVGALTRSSFGGDVTIVFHRWPRAPPPVLISCHRSALLQTFIVAQIRRTLCMLDAFPHFLVDGTLHIRRLFGSGDPTRTLYSRRLFDQARDCLTPPPLRIRETP